MSCWVISGRYTIDENSVEHDIIKDGEPIHLTPKCWSFLIALLEAKKHGRALSYGSLFELLWDKYEQTDEDSIHKLQTKINAVIGEKFIRRKNNSCYISPDYDIQELSSSGIEKKAYYEKLWQHHCKGSSDYRSEKAKEKELIDFFVLPTITEGIDSDKTVFAPFGGPKFTRFLTAGSGFGKSTLLDIALLCCIANELFASGSAVIGENGRKKSEEYKELQKSLFGSCKADLFPVFIPSHKANNGSYSSPLDLAEASETENFKELVDNAHSSGKLLFLIDSIDEVESDKMSRYLDGLGEMLSAYRNASVVFASRFAVSRILSFNADPLYIKELDLSGIKKIAFSILADEADGFIDRVQANPYLYPLIKNPFVLMVALNLTVKYPTGKFPLYTLLRAVVDEIIDLRWSRHNYNIPAEDMKLLLGFLACKFVFENKKYADISEIRRCFVNIKEELTLAGVDFNIPIRNIEFFLKTLSCQSGILNVVERDGIEQYLFQSDMVMCYLAAYYITHLIDCANSFIDGRGSPNEPKANRGWFDTFVLSVSPKEPRLSLYAVYAFVLALVILNNQGQDVQKSILYFLIYRDAISLDEQEQANIASGYRLIVDKSFGENNITNKDGEALKLINKMLFFQKLQKYGDIAPVFQ